MKRLLWVGLTIVILFIIHIYAIQAILELDLNIKKTIVWCMVVFTCFNIISMFAVFWATFFCTFNFSFEGLRKVLHDIKDALNADVGTTQLVHCKVENMEKDIVKLVDRKDTVMTFKANIENFEIKPNVDKNAQL